jgi:hypothetical protein
MNNKHFINKNYECDDDYDYSSRHRMNNEDSHYLHSREPMYRNRETEMNVVMDGMRGMNVNSREINKMHKKHDNIRVTQNDMCDDDDSSHIRFVDYDNDSHKRMNPRDMNRLNYMNYMNKHHKHINDEEVSDEDTPHHHNIHYIHHRNPHNHTIKHYENESHHHHAHYVNPHEENKKYKHLVPHDNGTRSYYNPHTNSSHNHFNPHDAAHRPRKYY